MALQGGIGNSSVVNVLDSTFNENGDGESDAGAGIVTFAFVIGTIVRSTMNNNIGPGGIGFIAQDDSEFTLIDVIANGNGQYGIVSEGEDSLVTVINSIACGNIELDISNAHIAQATTCDESKPPTIGGLPVCQCPCQL
jgi:hypothetical protein